jgi:magnesium-transporting ATPase (P-type)
MFLGYYTPLVETSVSPWTTLGPLALVVLVSLLQEAYTDIKRHRSDNTTNYHPCVVLRRAETLDHKVKGRHNKTTKRDPHLNDGHDLKVRVAGKEVSIAFQSVSRMNICSGDLVIVRIREMIPADLILLASANEGGSAYIETSSIDGETNLKLRNSPHIPPNLGLPGSAFSSSSLFNGRSLDENEQAESAESINQAVARAVNMSLLGHNDGVSALANPANADEEPILERYISSKPKGFRLLLGNFAQVEATRSVPIVGENITYIASLTSEPPNTHVNNYSGKLTLPPDSEGAESVHASLTVENILLRGAVLRNTQWVVGVACFTGADTKLVMNSVATPSKFSQLDVLINRTVFLVLFIMIFCVCSLGAISVYENKKSFRQLWYAGYSTDPSEPWPYFNLVKSSGIGNPQWETTTQNFIQNTVMFITLLSNFVPLALYVSVEIITIIMMMYVGWDLHMYHKESDTPAVARSSIVTDLGLVEYIFSDKTGTLTCNVMEFKRCSVDGHVFGMPVAKAAPQLDSFLKHPSNEEDKISDKVHPLKHLLADSGSAFSFPDAYAGLKDKLTFNAEMFLRVMSICHTVVVEKDHVVTLSDQVEDSKHVGGKPRAKLDTGGSHDRSGISGKAKKSKKKKKNEDGAPAGCAYQAESPDEGALVSAASKQYGFQLVRRNISGVQLSCPCPSLLEDKDIVKGLKDGSMSAKILAAKSASPAGASLKYSRTQVNTVDNGVAPRIETWPILAVNKFDSDRKRMSVLVRSPPELGSVHMLLCKGADSSMLIEEVCGGTRMLDSIVDKNVKGPTVKPESEADNSELDSLLGLQAHLGGKLILL